MKGMLKTMKEKLEKLKKEAFEKINSVDAFDVLNDMRVAYLGKKGEITALLKTLKDASDEERPKFGQYINDTRVEIKKYIIDLLCAKSCGQAMSCRFLPDFFLNRRQFPRREREDGRNTLL